ncbi:unnamed protein product [Hyaloperonospora brassicae]|uniref:RxLR effector candidate protein n=1 Tax=Hyaloperonospora brassicae TaxID=162125 RepID=A0AAV0UMX2_HYABA|nr:unnamed protein product [Hyaloperonospora brassicae]
MRLLWPLLTATGISLSIAARSTTASGGETDDAPRYLPAVVSPPKMNASIALELVKAHSDEERGESLLTPLLELLSKVKNGIRATEHTPLAMLKRLKIKAGENSEHAFDQRLKQWFQKVDTHRAKYPEYTVQKEVEDLLTLMDARELAKVLYRFRKVHNMQSRVNGLQQVLAAKNDRAVYDLIPVWLDDRVPPDEVFDMLPVAAMERIIDRKKEWERRVVVHKWLRTYIGYVAKYVGRGLSYDDAAVVTKLVEKRGEEESVDFLFTLWGYNGDKDRANSLQSTLGVKYPSTVELMFDEWLEFDRYPSDVYDMMPIGINQVLTKNPLKERKSWHVIDSALTPWVTYGVRFNKKHGVHAPDLSVDQTKFYDFVSFILRELKSCNEPQDLVDYVEHFRSVKELAFLAPKLQRRMLLAEHNEYEPLIFNAWAKSKLDPRIVYDSMPVASISTLGMIVAQGLEHECERIEQLLRYVDDVRVRESFSDKLVIELLLSGRATVDALRHYFKALGERGRKERSGLLLEALHNHEQNHAPSP